MTQWLLTLPHTALPPGIGTLAADISGLYIEHATPDDAGQFFSWQQVCALLLSAPQPATQPATQPAPQPLPGTTEARLADLEARVKGLTAALGQCAASATVQAHGERLAKLEEAVLTTVYLSL